RRLASACDDRSVKVWEALTGQEALSMQGHTSPAYGVAFSPSGTRLASSSVDRTVRVSDATGLTREALQKAANPTAQELEVLGTDLAGTSVPSAHRAMWKLCAAPRQAVPFLLEKLRPVPATDQARIGTLIADLDSGRFAVREKATQELNKLGDLAEGELR